MARRAKLKLIPNEQNAGKQTASFDSDVENADAASKARGIAVSAGTASGFKGKALLKTALVVAAMAAAVAVYLYRRRYR